MFADFELSLFLLNVCLEVAAVRVANLAGAKGGLVRPAVR